MASSMKPNKVQVTLTPTAGFCVKSACLQPATYYPKGRLQLTASPNTLEPQNVAIPVPKGLKIFLNICWDDNVPPPPEGSEDAIQKAMLGQDIAADNPNGWYVPVVISEGRQAKDKAGRPSLVFDCVFNKSIKSRCLRDPEFKIFVVELSLQRIEAQTSLVLSREIGMPNISAKGKLESRTVWIPSGMSLSQSPSASKQSLIQEVNPRSKMDSLNLKGILKGISSNPIGKSTDSAASKPTWSWSKDENHLKITLAVPGLTRKLVEESTLDIEPRRLILQVPNYRIVDVNTGISDAEIVATVPEHDSTLKLKRQRPFNVDGAVAEWKVGEGRIHVYV